MSEESGSASGAMHRGWVSVRGTLSGYRDLAILDESERGEDVAPAPRRKALKTRLPSDLEPMVQRLPNDTPQSRDHIKALREEHGVGLKPKARWRCRSANAAAGASARGEGQGD